MTGVRRAGAVMLCLFALAASSCRVTGLSIRTDKRVTIVSPANRQKVKIPFDVRWTVEDFKVVGDDGSSSNDAGSFAVLVDTTPMPPGAGLGYFSRNDDSCTRATGCPDASYLADRNIFVTRAESFKVDSLVDTRPPDRQGALDTHEITILLLNGKGQRIGESAFRVKVIVDRTVT